MDTRLMELLVCPVCKGPLQRKPQGDYLICRADHLGFPIRDGIPVMLENEAMALDENDNPLPGATSAAAAAPAGATGA
jgi:uncharacterized protein